MNQHVIDKTIKYSPLSSGFPCHKLSEKYSQPSIRLGIIMKNNKLTALVFITAIKATAFSFAQQC